MKANPHCKNLRAFTLLEVVIYAALITVLGIFVIGTVLQTVQSNTLLAQRVTTEDEVNFLFRKMVWALSGVSQIINPPAASSSSALTISKYNFSANPIVFDVASGSVRISRGGGPAIPLNNISFPVDTLTFTHQASVGLKPESVKVDLSIQKRSYSTVIYLRK